MAITSRGARSIHRIVDAAARMFGREGFRGASMHAVARAAGVSKGLLHYHFQSKEHLLIEAVRATFRQLHRRFDERFSAGDRGLAAATEALDALWAAIRDMHPWAPFMVETMGLGAQEGPLRQDLFSFYAESEAMLRTGIVDVFDGTAPPRAAAGSGGPAGPGLAARAGGRARLRPHRGRDRGGRARLHRSAQPVRAPRGAGVAMIHRLYRSRRDRAKARGVRPDVALPFDMFDAALCDAEARKAKKLENIYHKGQARAWDGRRVLSDLLEQHGGLDLPPSTRTALQGLFAVILWGELAAWKVSSNLALQLEPLEAKLAATSQAHDEARHFYVMHDYLALLGEVPRALGPRTTRVLLGTLQAPSLTKQLIGMQLMIEPMALALFQLVRESRIEPVLCDLLRLYERDEARHVALGVLHLPRLLLDLTPAEAIDVWAWEFREFWHQLGMLSELAPHFEALDIDVARVVEIGRAKQIRANQMLMEEMNAPIPVFEAFIRFFDAKIAWDWPTDRSDLRGRIAGVIRAAGQGVGVVPTRLSDVAQPL